MWILPTLLVSLFLSAVNGLSCGGVKCKNGEDACSVQYKLNGANCSVQCSKLNGVINECTANAKTLECYCDKDECHADSATIVLWKKVTLRKHTAFEKWIGVCSNVKKAKKAFICGRLCGDEHKSCVFSIQEGDDTCPIDCSAKDGSRNECTSPQPDQIECLCEESNCLKNETMIASWQRSIEDSNPSMMNAFDNCIVKKKLLKLSRKFKCNGKPCVGERNKSCHIDISHGGKCSGQCSYKPSNDKCEKLDSRRIRCTCGEDDCHKKAEITGGWSKREKTLITGFSGVDQCLYLSGATSKKSCGGSPCFYLNDNSCKLVIEKCKVECSDKSPMEKCRTGNTVECYCKDDNCHKQEKTVNKWMNELSRTKPQTLLLETCLIKQNVLSKKTCGTRRCFKNKDKSCILAFKPDGDSCDVECSAKAATDQCKMENGRFECSSGTDDFKAKQTIIEHLIKQRTQTAFSPGLEDSLQKLGILKNETCGEEKCFIGHNFCELWFNEDKCKIGCTTKDGIKGECHKISGKSEHQCICKGDGCFKTTKIIKQLIAVRKSSKFGEKLETCLQTKGILTTTICGKMPCFVHYDKSCRVKAKMDGTCDVGCSKMSTSLNKCQSFNNHTAVQCYCQDKDCHKKENTVNFWQNDLEPKSPILTSKLEQCLYDKDALDKSIKCGNQQCYKGRDTCKLEGKADGNCIVKCSTEKHQTSSCKKEGDQYTCFCNTADCLTSKSTAFHWKTNMSMSSEEGLRMEGCIDKFVTTTIRPLRTVSPETKVQETFEAKALDQAIASFMSSKPKQESSESGFTFKWWYVLMILALLATLGLFGFVAWSAATRKKRCADYWKKREEEEKKKKKDLAAAKKPVIPSKDAEMEVLPETDIIRKGPHHLQKKFKGETTAHLADNQKSESIHEKLEFVPQLNEEVQIGSDIEVIDGMEQTSVEDTVSVSRMDNFNTVRQASSMSTLVT